MTPNTLVIDIELLPIEAYCWQLFDVNVGLEQIKQEWSISSFAAKWVGEKKMFYEDTGGRGVKKVRDDKRLLHSIHKLFSEADIVVGQNHRRFDIKKINARMIEHGIEPYSPFRTVDTTVEARKHFGFTSNKLAWLSAHLTDEPKDEHKEFPGFSLWKECLADNPRAWAEKKKYNCQDVISTEAVYLKLLPWISSHPNYGTYIEDKNPRCIRCGSDKLQRRGYGYTQLGAYKKFQCQSCKGWTRGRENQLAPKVRKSLLVGV